MAFCDQETELIAALVEGGSESPLWSTFLDRLRRMTVADYATLSFRMPGRPFEDSITLLSGAAQTRLEETYRDFFRPMDPIVDEAQVAGRPYSLDELLGAVGAPKSSAYRKILALNGITAVRKLRVQDASGVDGWLTIIRGGADFGAEEDALMRAIAPVLCSVLRQYLVLERERFAASLTADAVRRLQFGWIMLDQRGHVLDSDEQGAHLLAHSGILSKSNNGRLAAHEIQLERKIVQALAKMAANDRSRPHAITLSRDPWFDMLLVPVRRKSVSAQAAPAIIAYVHGDSWRSTDRCEQLAELFRLSPKEAQIALALCRGMTICEAASEFGLAEGTARNYSKAIYAKTGARGLPDLVRIVMRSVLAIGPDG